MIREADKNDVDQIFQLVSEEMHVRGWVKETGCEPNEESIRALIHYHIRDSNGCAFVKEQDGKISGVFLGCVMPWLLDLKYRAAHEKMSLGENIDGLWDMFFEWARTKNAITCVRGCYDALEGSRFRRIR